MDGCAALGLGFDRKHSIYQLQTLFHADETESGIMFGRFAIKA